MKLNKFIKAAAVLLAAATVLAGCKFQGTTTSFKGNEENSYKAKDSVAEAGCIVDGSSSITAGEIAEVWLQIASRGELDKNSVVAAFDLYNLSDPADKNFAPVRTTALPGKKLRKIDVEYDKDDNGFTGTYVLTTAYFYIDATNVTTDYVAFKADATKLKEKTGALILNENGNKKCGEESDSYVAYVGVTGTGVTTNLNWNFAVETMENYSPTFGFKLTNARVLDETNTYPTGPIVYYLEPLSTACKTKADGTEIYANTDAITAALNKMYKFRTLPAGAGKWTESDLIWTWDDTKKYFKSNQTAALDYGTKYLVEVKENNSLEWPEAKDFYGHTPRMSWNDNKNHMAGNGGLETPFVFNTMVSEKSYILGMPDNNVSGAQTWAPVTDPTFETYQTGGSGLLSVEKHSNYVMVSIRDSYKNAPQLFRMKTYDGFVITDKYFNIVKTKAPVVYEQDSLGVISVMIELEDKNIDLTKTGTTYYFMVGEKTSIEENKSWPNQLKFGCPATYKQYGLPGYVRFSSF